MDELAAFEGALAVPEQWPNDPKLWPEPQRSVSDAAIQRLLDENPGAKVIEDAGFCMARGHERFPVSWPTNFALVRTVKLDRGAVYWCGCERRDATTCRCKVACGRA